MKIDNLPYPVLGINDDILPLPETKNAGVMEDGKNFIFEFDCIMDNPAILRIVQSGQAEFACEVECATTFFRKCYTQKDNSHFKIDLPKNLVAKTITLEPIIIVTSPITGYTNPLFNPDYEGLSFDLEPGDLLAYFKKLSYEADLTYENLKAAGTFMNIEKTDADAHTSVVLGGQKIKILLPEKLYDEYNRYHKADKRRESIIHASLAFNALLEGIHQYTKYKSTTWARAIKARIESDPSLAEYKYLLELQDGESLEENQAFEIAQAFLGDPYERMFKALRYISTNNDNDD